MSRHRTFIFFDIWWSSSSLIIIIIINIRISIWSSYKIYRDILFCHLIMIICFFFVEEKFNHLERVWWWIKLWLSTETKIDTHSLSVFVSKKYILFLCSSIHIEFLWKVNAMKLLSNWIFFFFFFEFHFFHKVWKVHLFNNEYFRFFFESANVGVKTITEKKNNYTNIHRNENPNRLLLYLSKVKKKEVYIIIMM